MLYEVITVENVGTGQEAMYTLVIPETADGKKNFVSIASPVGNRITSYNVCYTKLLRVPADGALPTFHLRKYSIREVLPPGELFPGALPRGRLV